MTALIDTDVECTPPEIFEPILRALGMMRFGTDPCTNIHALVPAGYRYALPTDGLAQEWHGAVWCNPPYSRPRPWIERCAAHAGTAVALLSGDFSTKMWREVIWPTAALVILGFGRVRFFNPATPDRRTTAKRPHALAFWKLPASFDTTEVEGLGRMVVT